MSLASELLSILDRFRTVVASHVNSGQLITIDSHISQLAGVAEGDVQTAETKAQDVLGELYGALHAQTSGGAAPTPTPTPVVDEGQAAAAAPGTAAATPAKTAAATPATTASTPSATGTAAS